MLSSFSSPSPSPTPDPSNDVVKDVTLSNFKAEVLEASQTCLVLVDFWATWCGPCKQLTPILEKLARASKGMVRLAKMDVDKNQPIAQQMGVQSVPSVFAFAQGRPVDAFAGALPEAQIKTWIDELLKKTGLPPSDDKLGLETALKQAADFRAAKDPHTARSIYADILDMDPANATAYAGLMHCFIDEGDYGAAREMLTNAPPELIKHKALEQARAALDLAEQVGGVPPVVDLETKFAQNPSDPQIRFDLALALCASGQREAAVDHLLELVKHARAWNDDAARKQLVKFFEAFGVMDPLTVSARKRLSTILFS